MPKPPITRFSAVDVSPTSTNNNNGMYAPKLTTAQRDKIPASAIKDGGIIYNINDEVYQLYSKNKWRNLDVATGYVIGPTGSKVGDIATFSTTGGNMIQDSGVNIVKVPVIPPVLQNKNVDAPLVTVNEISNIGYIQFVNDASAIYVDSLTAVEFIPNTHNSDTQINIVFTGGLPSGGSSSHSALVELNTTEGALLLSRLTQSQIDALVTPQNGMIVYNTNGNQFTTREKNNWTAVVTSSEGDTAGIGELLGGSATIETTYVTANSIILVNYCSTPTNPIEVQYITQLVVSLVTPGSSFEVFSNNASDNSSFYWQIINPKAEVS